MSNALAIAGVTAVLRDLLDDGLVNASLDALGASVCLVNLCPLSKNSSF